jgi:hypothetical protein
LARRPNGTRPGSHRATLGYYRQQENRVILEELVDLALVLIARRKIGVDHLASILAERLAPP